MEFQDAWLLFVLLIWWLGKCSEASEWACEVPDGFQWCGLGNTQGIQIPTAGSRAGKGLGFNPWA